MGGWGSRRDGEWALNVKCLNEECDFGSFDWDIRRLGSLDLGSKCSETRKALFEVFLLLSIYKFTFLNFMSLWNKKQVNLRKN